ncbi:MAG: hydroxymethylbilane synthase, partial [Gammaproteobacteria bacterium]|nr:hydroxymethylbilane synthase [Gammaproteobacteria bacterium]
DHLDIDVSLPAAGQGALGIECLADDATVVSLVGSLNDAGVHRCVATERAVAAGLGADCSMPLGAYAELVDDSLYLRALLASPDGRTLLRAEARGTEGKVLSQTVVAALRDQGADRLLSQLVV